MSTVSDPNVVVGPGRRVLILISGVLTVALYFTSILVASTVLPQMQGTFAATPDEISWAITFNILATAIAMPMTGWLVARFGRRQVMIWSTTVFTVSTCFAAQPARSMSSYYGASCRVPPAPPACH